MTLNRIRWISIAAPVVVVVALELARSLAFGALPYDRRFFVDATAFVAVMLFYAAVFRYASQIQARLERQNRELLALHAAGLDVASELSLDAVLKKVVDQARQLVGAKYGALSVVGKDHRIEAFVTSGISTDDRAKIGAPPVGHGLLGVPLYEGERLRLADISHDPRRHGFPANHPPMRSLLAVPITCKGPFVGNLYLTEKEGAPQFAVEDEDTLERFATQAAIAIDNAHLHQQVADLAIAEERLRIAHEMHDGLAQVLGYVNTKVQAANAYIRRSDNANAAVQLNELADAARAAYVDVREGIVGLRTLPDPDRSLADALREFIDRWREQSGIDAELAIDDDLHLRPNYELQLVRIVQEALTNVRKHARATKATVGIHRRNGNVVTTITDDGVGFYPGGRRHDGEFPRFGLHTMHERAAGIGGALTVESAPGRGTTVTFELPISE